MHQLGLIQDTAAVAKLGDTEVCTVHSYIGQEADFVVTVTTRTKPAKGMDFVLEARTTCVAMTRAREGFWVIGNFDYLYQPDKVQNGKTILDNAAMRQFVEASLESTPPLDARSLMAYLDEMFPADNSVNQAFQPIYDPLSGTLLTQKGATLIADCDVGKRLGWRSFTPNRTEVQTATRGLQKITI